MNKLNYHLNQCCHTEFSLLLEQIIKTLSIIFKLNNNSRQKNLHYLKNGKESSPLYKSIHCIFVLFVLKVAMTSEYLPITKYVVNIPLIVLHDIILKDAEFSVLQVRSVLIICSYQRSYAV